MVKMNRPPYGLCFPVERFNVIDGDTVAVVFVGGSHVWKIRLLDCWCSELHEPAGREAKQYAEKLLATSAQLSVFVPQPKDTTNLIRAYFSFDRLLGHIFISETQTLSEMLVAAGHATKEKGKK